MYKKYNTCTCMEHLVHLCFSSNCFSYKYLSFCSNLKFKKGVTLREKLNQNFLWICTLTLLQKLSFKTTKFQEILLSGFRGVALTNCFSGIFYFGQISKLKNWIKISCGYGHLHIMSLITTKFNKILLSGFRGVALIRKTGLTDGRVKNIIPSATLCMVYKYQNKQ